MGWRYAPFMYLCSWAVSFLWVFTQTKKEWGVREHRKHTYYYKMSHVTNAHVVEATRYSTHWYKCYNVHIDERWRATTASDMTSCRVQGEPRCALLTSTGHRGRGSEECVRREERTHSHNRLSPYDEMGAVAAAGGRGAAHGAARARRCQRALFLPQRLRTNTTSVDTVPHLSILYILTSLFALMRTLPADIRYHECQRPWYRINLVPTIFTNNMPNNGL